jgi:hypothetical protein
MAERTTSEGLTFSERALSVLAGIGSATAAAVTTIRSEFFRVIRDVPQVSKHLKETHDTLQKMSSDAFKTAVGHDPAARAGYFKKIQDYKQLRETSYNTLVESMGYRSKGWTGLTLGTLDRAQQMSQSTRNHVILSSVITATIGIAGTSMFFGSRHIRKNLANIQTQLDEQDGRRNTSR